MTPKHIDVGERRAEMKVGVSLRRACIAFFIFYLAAAVLNGRALHEGASRRPYGTARDVWMTATAPLRWAAVTLKLDRIRAVFENVLEDEP